MTQRRVARLTGTSSHEGLAVASRNDCITISRSFLALLVSFSLLTTPLWPLLLLGLAQLFTLIVPVLAPGRLPLAQPFLAAIDSAPTSPAVSRFALVLPVFSSPGRAAPRSLRRTRRRLQLWPLAAPLFQLLIRKRLPCTWLLR